MRISELVDQLQALQIHHGDLEVRVLDDDGNLDMELRQVEVSKPLEQPPFILLS